MRDKLQALVDEWKDLADAQPEDDWLYAEGLSLAVKQLESILATEPPAVTVRAGWVVKDRLGLWWCEQKPELFADGKWDIRSNNFYLWEQLLTDPWSESHPYGGPECCMEVR